MSRKKWALFILLLLLGFGYYKLFYKTWKENRVPASADMVLALDVKRVTNTLIWQFLTTPSKWETGDLFSKRIKDTSWRDMFTLPDYVFVFHMANQPLHNWYTVLNMKSREGFESGIRKYGFEKRSEVSFLHKEAGVYLYVNGNEVLLALASAADSASVQQVARELFNEKKFLARAEIQKAINTKSHLALYLAPGSTFREAALLTANFDKASIRLDGRLAPAQPYSVAEEDFLYNSRSLSSIGMVQPPADLYTALGIPTKEKISKALGVDADSFFIASNRSYSVDLQAIRERQDTAITYSYDDDFNPVENKVLNTVREPAFSFFANGAHTDSVFGYLQRNQKLENSAGGMVFLPMPLVKSFCDVNKTGRLSITAFNYRADGTDASVKALFFFRLAVASLPNDLLRYLPYAVTKLSRDVDEIRVAVNKEANNAFRVTGMLTKKKNARLLIDF